jgi:hypothetical protein
VRRSLLALALLLWARTLSAADVTVRAEVDAHKVGAEDPVQLSLILEGDAQLLQEVALPALQGLRNAGGPSVSTQLSYVNGAMSQRRVYTWALQPTAVGKAEVGSFAVKLASGDKFTAPIALEVVPGSIRAAPGRGNATDPFGGENPLDALLGRRNANRPAPKVLVKAVASRARVHVGEPMLLTYYVYTQTNITNLRVADAPQYPGFWSEDLPQPEGGPRGEPVTLEGERFQRFPFLRKLLFPTRSGTLPIPAATFHVGVARRSFFDMGDANVTRSSDALEITALPIPEEPGFSGAVGRFRATATLDKSSVALGEAATLRFRVDGSGNLKWIDKGPAVVVPGAKVYPPSTSSDLKPGPNGISGSKTWEFAIVPETAGSLEVPALPFVYFDPAAGRVVTAETSALPIAVQGGAPGAVAAPLAASAPARAAGPLPLRAELDLPAALLPRPSARWLGGALLVALLLHVSLMVGPAMADRLRARSGRTAPRRTARTALAEIERIGRDGLGKEAAAAALERALHDVFGPMENGGPAPSGERERAARAVLDDVRFLRYAPQLGDYSDKIREVAARAADLVRRWA